MLSSITLRQEGMQSLFPNWSATVRSVFLRRAVNRREGEPDLAVKSVLGCKSRRLENMVRHERLGMELASTLNACLPLRGAYAGPPLDPTEDGVAYYLATLCAFAVQHCPAIRVSQSHSCNHALQTAGGRAATCLRHLTAETFVHHDGCRKLHETLLEL